MSGASTGSFSSPASSMSSSSTSGSTWTGASSPATGASAGSGATVYTPSALGSQPAPASAPASSTSSPPPSSGATMFGLSTSTPSLAPGAPSPPPSSGGSLFGFGASTPALPLTTSPPPLSSGASLFGLSTSSPAPASGPQSPPPSSGGSLFGCGTSSSPPAFGTPSPPPSSGATMFGLSTSSPAPASGPQSPPLFSGGSLFGFGAPTSAPALGTSSPPLSSGATMFGPSTSSPAPASGAQFPPPSSGGSLFGFGASTSAPASSTFSPQISGRASLFRPATSSPALAFGAPPPPPSSGSSSALAVGATSPSASSSAYAYGIPTSALASSPSASSGDSCFGTPTSASGVSTLASSSGGGLFGQSTSSRASSQPASSRIFTNPLSESDNAELRGAPSFGALHVGPSSMPGLETSSSPSFRSLVGTPSTSAPAFGDPAPASGSRLFGSASTGSGLFASASTGTGLFEGASTGSGSSRGASTGSSLFTGTSTGSGLFGGTSTGSGLFGTPARTPAFDSSFGTPPPPGSLFGTPPSTSETRPFRSSLDPPFDATRSAYGGFRGVNEGTRFVPFQRTVERDGTATGAGPVAYFMNIMAMLYYSSKSVEELRFEDYQRRTAEPFGRPEASFRFGAAAPEPPFNASSPFRPNWWPPPYLEAASPFGGPALPAFPPAFGAPNPTSSTQFGGLGSLFHTSAPGSAPAFGSSSTGESGGFGGFGMPSSAPAFASGASAFGTPGASSSFGASTSGRPFGSSAPAFSPQGDPFQRRDADADVQLRDLRKALEHGELHHKLAASVLEREKLEHATAQARLNRERLDAEREQLQHRVVLNREQAARKAALEWSLEQEELQRRLASASCEREQLERTAAQAALERAQLEAQARSLEAGTMPAVEQSGQQAEPPQQAPASSAQGDGQKQAAEMPTSSSDSGPSREGQQLQQPIKHTISETPSHTGTLRGASGVGSPLGRLTISSDGSMMVSAFNTQSSDPLATVRMWNVPDKACCWEIPEYGRTRGSTTQNKYMVCPTVTDVSLMQNGSSVMTSWRLEDTFSRESGSIRVWSTTTGSQRVSLSSAGPVSRVAPGADAAHIISLAKGHFPYASLWNLDTAQLIESFDIADAKGSSGHGTSLAVLSGGSACLVGHEKGFSLWDLRAHQKADLLDGKGRTDTTSVRDIAAKPDGSFCVTAMQSGALMVWDLRAPQSCVATLMVHEKAATSVAFAPDARHFISGSEDETVRVLDLAGGQCKLTMRGHGAGITSVVAFPDGMNCASASLDGTIRLWRYAD